jgi:hypothetical protein
MTFEELSEWTIASGAKEKLSSEVRQRVSRELPPFVRDIDPKLLPKGLDCLRVNHWQTRPV